MKKLFLLVLIILICTTIGCTSNTINDQSSEKKDGHSIESIRETEHIEESNDETKLAYEVQSNKKLDEDDKCYYDQVGNFHIKPYVYDYPDYSNDAIEQYYDDLETYKGIKEKIDKGVREEELTTEEKEINEYFYRGFSPWCVDPGCGWYCGGYFKAINATSELELKGDIEYSAEQINDFYTGTCWCEGVDGYGIGEKITMITDSIYIPQSISIYNGYGKSKETFKNNSRAKELLLKINDIEIGILDLEDIRNKQVFCYDAPFSNEEGKDIIFTIEILSVYQGDLYEDTCISDIVVADGH